MTRPVYTTLEGNEAIDTRLVPAGCIFPTIAFAADAGYLFLNGQTVTNAQTLYPALWAKAPAAWKSGSSLVLPDARQRVLGGASLGTLGGTAGSNTKTLAAANLPPHAHTFSGTASGTTSGASADHYHPFSTSTGFESLDHRHEANVSGAAFMQRLPGYSGALLGLVDGGAGTNTAVTYTDQTGLSTNSHSHGVSGNTDGASVDHSHTYSTTVSGNTGNGPGTATPLDVLPAVLVVNYQIKAH